jgi:hypothetical protein
MFHLTVHSLAFLQALFLACRNVYGSWHTSIAAQGNLRAAIE